LRDFATSLKHKRKEFTFDDLIATLDVEEKARAKDTRGKTIASPSSANFVQRGNPKFHNNQNKRKKPSQNPPKAKEADGPNKKKRKPRGVCYTCGSPDHCNTLSTKAAPPSPSVGASTCTHSTMLTLSSSLRVKGLTRGWYGWWTKAYKLAPPLLN
jgi:hypothetical protein